ncbi:MAG: fused MFS/spermidine synthase [Bifidobacterium sp.]|nr:fused MFS/spermidine synthase [Bifidobacterium sp.]
MGTGTYARDLRKYCPDMQITGVEIDDKITELAGEYFSEPADIPVVTYDGRAYLNAVTDTYDVIMVDAYQDITIPFQMSSEEFFRLVYDHLKPGGVMVVNMNMISDGEGSINEALTDTIAAVFGAGEMLTADVPGTTNRELFAKRGGDGVPTITESLEAMWKGGSTLDRTVQQVDPLFVPVSVSGNDTVLTDDKAPVEILGIHAIDGIIAEEAGPYREAFEKDGIQGLLRAVQ